MRPTAALQGTSAVTQLWQQRCGAQRQQSTTCRSGDTPHNKWGSTAALGLPPQAVWAVPGDQQVLKSDSGCSSRQSERQFHSFARRSQNQSGGCRAVHWRRLCCAVLQHARRGPSQACSSAAAPHLQQLRAGTGCSRGLSAHERQQGSGSCPVSRSCCRLVSTSLGSSSSCSPASRISTSSSPCNGLFTASALAQPRAHQPSWAAPLPHPALCVC